ncbi:kiwellin [Quercus suber]|uniref:Kiwellin n=1 Tax=Quercus suber TaxID=58331 RepID=A0AAW0KRJ2_QUESU
MKNQIRSIVILLFFLLLLVTKCSNVEAHTCKPSDKSRGKKPPRGQCNPENDSECCVEGKARLTINSFKKGGDGGGPSECDNRYHSDDTPVVALSTGWFNKKRDVEDYLPSMEIRGLLSQGS